MFHPQKTGPRSWEDTQPEEGLLCKHEDLRSVPRTAGYGGMVLIISVMVGVGGVEMGRSLGMLANQST